MFEFNLTLDDEDYLAFNKYHALNSIDGKRNLLMLKLLMPLMCFLLIFIFWFLGDDLLLLVIETVFLTVLSVLWVFFSVNVMMWSLKMNIKMIKKGGKLPYNKGAVIKFDGEQICEISPENEVRTKYTMVEKVAVAEKAVYIYVGSMQAYILPMSAFVDADQRQEFLEFINGKVQQKQDMGAS